MLKRIQLVCQRGVKVPAWSTCAISALPFTTCPACERTMHSNLCISVPAYQVWKGGARAGCFCWGRTYQRCTINWMVTCRSGRACAAQLTPCWSRSPPAPFSSLCRAAQHSLSGPSPPRTAAALSPLRPASRPQDLAALHPGEHRKQPHHFMYSNRIRHIKVLQVWERAPPQRWAQS